MRKNKITAFVLPLLLTSALVAVGCSTSNKKAELAGDPDPQNQIQSLEKDMATAREQHLDILAPSDFKKSKDAFKEAKDNFAKREKTSEVISDIQSSRFYLNSAYKTAEPRRGFAKNALDARRIAIQAGAPLHKDTNSKLDGMDRRLSKNADNLKSMDADDLVELQNDYMQLARESAIQTQLGDSMAIVQNADRNNLDNKAPESFKRAEIALANAKSVVTTNITQPESYKAAVTYANTRAMFLRNVLQVMKDNNNDITEKAAADLVNKNQQIANLDTRLDTANAEQAQTSSDLARNRQTVARLRPTVEIQRALEAARSSFAADEAEAYQQGNKLLIRMKSMQFPVGDSSLPTSAVPLVAKLGTVAKDLDASEIVIQGHTDSTGSAKINEELSQSRADAIAAYLKSNGFENTKITAEGKGFSQPLGTNKTSAGRAQNRRVDVIITPRTTASREDDSN